jgi:ribosomal protein L44E
MKMPVKFKTYCPFCRSHQVHEVEKVKKARTSGLQTGLSVGATLLGALTGRRKISASTLGKATTAARGATRTMGQQQDVARAEETLETAQQQLAELEAEFEAEKEALAQRIDPLAEELATVAIKPKKADIAVELVALAWTPYWQDTDGVLEPAW